METSTGFNSYQYDDLLARSHDLYANTKYEIILQWLEKPPPMRILNAGCGSGDLSFLLARAGHRVHGIDPAAEYIELARRFAVELEATLCTFEVSSIESLTLTEKYDCVIATDVLEHIGDDRGAAALLASFVKPGGTLIITVPAGQWLFGYHDKELGHFRRYCRRALLRALDGAAVARECRYFGFTLIPICFLYSKVLKKPYPLTASGNPAVSPVRNAVLRALLRMDKKLPMPFGTSLLLRATAPD
jgi:SAM-dependent methyltransferase